MADRKFSKRLMFQMVFPNIWPVHKPYDFDELQLPEGRLFLSARPDKRFEIWFLAEEPVEYGKFKAWQKGKILTPAIEAEGGATITAEVLVSDDEVSEVLFAGINLLQTGTEESVRVGRDPSIKTSFAPDYWAKENEVCRLKRIERLQGLRSNVYRNHPGAKYDFEALATELLQLRDLIAAIESGAEHHVSGLLARNRALLYEKTRLGLVQLCAAHLGVCCLFPFRPQIASERLATTDAAVSFIPASYLGDDIREDFPLIDIDHWLEQTGLVIDGKRVKNRQIVKDLGNGLGAHRMPSSNDVTKFLSGRPQLFENDKNKKHMKYNDSSKIALEIGYLLLQSAPPLLERFDSTLGAAQE